MVRWGGLVRWGGSVGWLGEVIVSIEWAKLIQQTETRITENEEEAEGSRKRRFDVGVNSPETRCPTETDDSRNQTVEGELR